MWKGRKNFWMPNISMDEDIFLNICYDAEEFKMEICLFSVLTIKDIKKFTDLIYLKLPEISTVYK